MKLRYLATMTAFALLAACGVQGGKTAPDDEPSAPTDDDGSGGFDGVSSGQGGDDGGAVEQCEAVSQEATNQVRPVDIIWAVDTSPSMNAEKNAVRDNLNLFAQQIGTANIDVHVVLIAEPVNAGGICIDAPLGSGSCPNDHNPPAFHHNTQWVGSHNALGRFLGEYTEYKSALRESSVKYLAVVTDDSAEIDAASFSAQLAGLDPGWWDDWKLFGLFCANQDSGGIYQSLVSQSGGLAVELCQGQPNWQSVFDALAAEVVEAKSLDCAWAIPEPPDGKAFNRDEVNVLYTPGGAADGQTIYYVESASDCGPEGGWFYDDALDPQTIEACPSTCETIQADLEGKIDILFGCSTESVVK